MSHGDDKPRPESGSPRRVRLDLAFHDLSYCVKVGLRRESRALLKEVSGLCRSGQLTAIMGPSGAGKTTLMNVLAGYTRRGVTGDLLVNGLQRDPREFQSMSCYIMQDDKLQPHLSVSEAMTFAANLKIPDHHRKHDKIQKTLQSLGLEESRKTRIGKLSGGQRKRLAIALELINNPPVMFFDEPTSGLDSSATKQCVMQLKLLAEEGRTIVCTIHQPSALIFEMFDHLCIIASGCCVYQGCTSEMLTFLSNQGLNCPPYHNPADYVLEVCTGDYGEGHVEKLVQAIENGKCERWHRRIGSCSSKYAESIANGSITSEYFHGTPEIGPLVDTTKKPRPKLYAASFPAQFLHLIRRTFLIHFRDSSLTRMRLMLHIVIGFLIGTLFFGIGNDAGHTLNNFSFLYFCLMFIQFTAFSTMSLTFPLELPVVAREHFNRWYSLGSYYAAVTLADIPTQIMCTFAYVIVAYFMTSQPYEFHRFTLFLIMCILVGLVSQSIGLIFGISMTVQNSMVFGPLAICPSLIFSGFFVYMKDAPSYFDWLFHMSYMKYSLEGLMLAMYGYDRPRLKCYSDYCHYSQPKRFLQEVDMDGGSYWVDAVFLISLFFFLRLIGYCALLLEVYCRRTFSR
ncbi:ATP-binding cassette sub-family G member 1-like [Schistocerca americana]|uniref:ATP-binding cassette sub-family G member 1-like n=1 Tax=Schistocerca americana TaxID=7009 RepID=UPI001F5002EE|nr:ATP-binding cassette sub-family G member 1-like [Schistocerca americana]